MSVWINNLDIKARLRNNPGIFFGGKGIEGVEEAFRSMLSVFSEEALRGHGSVIKIQLLRNSSLSISIASDRGLQLGEVDSDGSVWKKNLEDIPLEVKDYNEYVFGTGEGPAVKCGYDRWYNFPVFAVNRYVSEWFSVTSRGCLSENVKTISFSDGELYENLKETDSDMTGTSVNILYSSRVFEDVNISSDFILRTIEQAAALNKGVTYTFTREEDGFTESFRFRNIREYIEKLAGDDLFLPVFEFEKGLKGKDNATFEDYEADVRMAVGLTRNTFQCKCFINEHSLKLGGEFLNEFFRLLKRRISHGDMIRLSDGTKMRLTTRELKRHLVIIFDIRTRDCRYEWHNNERTGLDNRMLVNLVSYVCKNELMAFISGYDDKFRELGELVCEERLREKKDSDLAQRLTDAISDLRNGDGKGALIDFLLEVPDTEQAYKTLEDFIYVKECQDEILYYYVLMTRLRKYMTSDAYRLLRYYFESNISENLPEFFGQE